MGRSPIHGQDFEAVTDADGIARIEFTVSMQPGNNFKAFASTSKDERDAVDIFMADGHDPLPEGIEKSEVLTVWRKLHVERDSMKAPPENEVFDPARPDGDVRFDPDIPSSALDMMISNFRPAYIEVVDDLADFDEKDDADWVRNLTPNMEGPIGDSVRDVQSTEDFWVIQIFGAYEGLDTEDWDPEVIESATFGSAFSSSTIIFLETIRDRAEHPGNVAVPKSLDEATFIKRTILHESVHDFGLKHGQPYGDEGPLRENGHELNYDPDTMTWDPYDPTLDFLTPGQLDIIRRTTNPVG